MVNYAELQNLQQLRERFLIRLYEKSNGYVFSKINFKELNAELDISDEVGSKILQHLKGKGLAKFITFGNVTITTLGIEKAEKIMAQNYEELEYQILAKLVENGRHSNDKELADYFSISKDYLYVFLNDFYKKGFVGLIVGGTIQLYDSGITAFHKWDKQAHSGITQITNNTTNVHGVNSGNITTGGQNNYQSIHTTQIVTNSDFNAALESIISLIKDSSLVSFKKEDLITDIERIKQLSETEASPELIDHAKSRINYLETAIKATDLATKLAPYFPQLYAYFEGLLK